ncbi:MAG TPA: hypothetical protein PKV16_00015 [Caldisericia bacterium]|nr:hypothetical protein [Caldisericia bacterium]HPF49647.1 hypothetical protein [Caldisericia bacterium]HPI84629.1 hypothetical protein [Caldisericia bacterium]HPQ92161.1 hypothetical protein [Caldisericia bacterium]HRV74741.1 hypothetical protein [Caldisericia bacterium]
MKKDITGTINVVETWMRSIDKVQLEIQEIHDAWITELGRLESNKLKEVAKISKWIKDNITSVESGTQKELRDGWDKEKKELESEAKKLQKSIDSMLKESDLLEVELGKRRKQLDSDNPEINDREEELKSKIEVALKDVKDVERELSRYDGFAGLFNRSKARELNKEFESKMRKLTKLTGQLEELREQWHARLGDISKEEGDDQSKWQKLQSQITEEKCELEHIKDSFEDISLTNFVLGLLDSNKELRLPTETQKQLDQARAHSEKVEKINKGIRRIASLIGAVNGVEKGLGQLNKSFESLLREQRMHSQLPKLVLDIPDDVISYNSIWEKLTPKIKDESKFVDEPTHLANELEKLVEQYLSMENIKAMFNLFGHAIKVATSSWSA